ncbi:MAG: hypothetical protein ACREJG_12325 [Candidatus Rokuibacteriota bacterium]
MAEMGWFPNEEPLVTLVVSEDRSVIRHECRGLDPAGAAFGCQRLRSIVLDDGTRVRAVKIVRYTDRLPSPMAFEIDIHELCHAIASVQGVMDPCHGDLEGVIESALPGAPRTRLY